MLQPPVGDISVLDFHKADKLVEIVYEYTITEWQRLENVMVMVVLALRNKV